MVKAIYPGSFDPITLGHLDIIKRSTKICDELIIGVGNNTKKQYLLTVDERQNLIEEVVKEELTKEEKQKITVKPYSSLLIDFAVKENVQMIIRGLRAFSDFDFEFNLAGSNQILNPKIETIFLITNINKQFIASSTVNEIHSFNGDISAFVPKAVINFFKRK